MTISHSWFPGPIAGIWWRKRLDGISTFIDSCLFLRSRNCFAGGALCSLQWIASTVRTLLCPHGNRRLSFCLSDWAHIRRQTGCAGQVFPERFNGFRVRSRLCSAHLPSRTRDCSHRTISKNCTRLTLPPPVSPTDILKSRLVLGRYFQPVTRSFYLTFFFFLYYLKYLIRPIFNIFYWCPFV